MYEYVRNVENGVEQHWNYTGKSVRKTNLIHWFKENERNNAKHRDQEMKEKVAVFKKREKTSA